MKLTSKEESNREYAASLFDKWKKHDKYLMRRLFPNGLLTTEQAMKNVAKLYERIQQNPKKLDMANWHCGTSHCLAGWSQYLFDKTTSKTEVNKYGSSRSRFTPSQAGYLYTWPIAHMFYETELSYRNILERLERILTRHGYTIESV